MKKILVIAAHPDDEVLGCGGTIARLAQEGNEVHTLILGEGITSRDTTRDQTGRQEDLSQLRQQAVKANKILGVKNILFADFPDNRFDSVPLLDIVKEIEKIKDKIKPEIIFTHYGKDLNIDHQITCQAVITATRPIENEVVKEIYSFEVQSSTEWNFPLSFSPDTFFDISKTLEVKVKALKEYESELRKYPHPRSLEGVELNAKYWGMRVGLNCAEVFKIVRAIR